MGHSVSMVNISDIQSIIKQFGKIYTHSRRYNSWKDNKIVIPNNDIESINFWKFYNKGFIRYNDSTKILLNMDLVNRHVSLILPCNNVIIKHKNTPVIYNFKSYSYIKYNHTNKTITISHDLKRDYLTINDILIASTIYDYIKIQKNKNNLYMYPFE